MKEKLHALPVLAQQIIRFLLVGGTCYVVVMALLIWFVEGLHLAITPANILASLLVMGLAYVLNARFVFQSGRHHVWKEALGFFLFAAAGYLINVGLMHLLITYTPIHYLLVKTCVVALVAGLNFLTRKFLIFKG